MALARVVKRPVVPAAVRERDAARAAPAALRAAPEPAPAVGLARRESTGKKCRRVHTGLLLDRFALAPENYFSDER